VSRRPPAPGRPRTPRRPRRPDERGLTARAAPAGGLDRRWPPPGGGVSLTATFPRPGRRWTRPDGDADRPSRRHRRFRDPGGGPGLSAAAAGLRRRDARAAARVGDAAVHGALLAAALTTGLVTVRIVVALGRETVTFLGQVPLGEFLTGTTWSPVGSDADFGALPLVGGTLVVAGIAMLVAVPFGLLAGAWLSEWAAPRARAVIKPASRSSSACPRSCSATSR